MQFIQLEPNNSIRDAFVVRLKLKTRRLVTLDLKYQTKIFQHRNNTVAVQAEYQVTKRYNFPSESSASAVSLKIAKDVIEAAIN